MTITQSTSRAVIEWNGFSIGSGASVTFENGSGATLNRVVGGIPSELMGSLQGSGSVYLLNPAGVLIGKDATVKVTGGFIASTLSLSNDSFMSGGSFIFSGDATTSVVNLGSISSSGGDVFLIAREVRNEGSISAPGGTVGLAAGSTVLLRDGASDQRVFVQAGGTSLTNSGRIAAATAELASADGNIYALAGNDGGLISATGIEDRGGRIWLTTGGETHVSTTLYARKADGSGGAIETSGSFVGTAGATIDAGVGGKWLLDPNSLTIDSVLAATINTTLGAGTDVTQQTTSTGTGGNGDITVTSSISWNTDASLEILAFRNLTIATGVTIANGNASTHPSAELTLRGDNEGTGTGSVIFQGTGKVDFSNSAGQAAIGYNPIDGASHTTVNAQRYTTTVGYTGGSAGYVNEVLIGTNGAKRIAAMNVNTVEDLQNVRNNLSATYVLGPATLDASGSAAFDGGLGFAPIGDSTTPFTGVFFGNDSTIDSLTIARPSGNFVGLFGVVGTAGVVDGVKLTNASITGSTFVGGIAGTNRGTISSVDVGAATVGFANTTITGSTFVGGVVGNNEGTVSETRHSGMLSGDSFVGGIAGQSYGTLDTVTNSGLITSGASSVSIGGIAGASYGTITQAVNTGPVNGSYSIGGIAGENDGTISNSRSSGAVNGAAIGTNAGGLVGLNVTGATITQSVSSGSVTTGASFQNVGGLVGENDGTITQSFRGGLVNAGSDNAKIGGLVGTNFGTITQSFALGQVNTASGSQRIGGLVGDNGTGGAISQSYASVWLNPTSSDVIGGLTGNNSGTVSTNSFWNTEVSGKANGTQTGTAIPMGQGLTTAQAQSTTALAAIGFTVGGASPFAIIDGKSFPYLTWRFPTAPQIISGTAYRDAAGTLAATGATIAINVNGNPVFQNQQASASGYYYLMFDAGTLPDGIKILTNFVGGATRANSIETIAGGTATGIDLLANQVTLYGNGGTVRTSDLVQAKGALSSGDIIYSVSGNTITAGAGRSIAVIGRNSAVEIDRSLVTTGVGTLLARGNGTLTINSGVTLTSAATGDAITLSSGTSIVNNATGALNASAGRWLVYSANPAADTVGDLSPAFLQYAATVGTTAVQGTGNGFLYSLAPTLTVSLTGTVTKTYDGTTAATLLPANYSVSGGITGDTITLGNATSTTFDTKNAGTGKTVTATGLTFTATRGALPVYGYASASPNVSGAIGTINAATLTAGLTGAISKTYDSTTAATLTSGNYSLTGAIGGDTVALNNPAAGTFDTKNVGTGKTISVAGLALSGADAGNYVLASTSASAAIGTINVATVTASLIGTVTKAYDGTAAASLASNNYTLTGAIGGDLVTLVPTAGSYETKNVGTGKTVSFNGLTLSGTDAGNYTLATSSLSGSIGTINAAVLTAGLTGTIARTYDGTTAATLVAGNYTLTGIVSGESVALNNPASGTYDTKNAGTGKTVSVTGLALSGADVGNYTLASTSASAAIGTINAATLTAGLTGTVSKTYDGTTAATLVSGNYTLTGAIGGDTVALNNPTAGTYDTRNVGTGKAVNVAGLALSGADAGNYALASTSLSGNIGAINAASVTAALTGTVTKTYDGTTAATLAAGNYALTGTISGDQIAIANTAGTYDTKNVGTGKTVSISGLTLGGADAGNYTLATNSLSGAIGTINAATLTAGLTGTVTKTYDGTTAATLGSGNYTLTGAIGGDAVALNNPTAGSYDTKNAGTGKTVSVAGLAISGADAGNYVLAANSLSAPIGTINAATLTAGLTGTVVKSYDGTTVATFAPGNYTLTGAIGGDQVAIATTTGSYDTKNIGSGKTVSVAGLALGGTDAGNYTLATSSLSAAIGTINAAVLTASLTGSVIKTYDGTTTATLESGNYTLAGVVSGESVALNNPTAGSYDTRNAGTGKTVSVAGLAISGADAGNYTLASTEASGAVGTINAATLIAGLTGSVVKTYDGTTVATLVSGNYTLTGAVGGDTVALNNPTAGSYDTRNVGTGKTVTVAGLALSGGDAGNYNLASTSLGAAIGTINAAGVTAALTGNVGRIYDGTTTATLAPANFVLTGIVAGDQVAIATTTGSYDTKNVGMGKTVSIAGLALGGADAGNYNLQTSSLSGPVGSIGAAVLSVGLKGSVAKTYDGTTVATLTAANYTLVGVVGGENVVLNSPTAGTYDTKNAGTNKIVSVTGLSVSGADVGNYTLASSAIGASVGTINQATLTAALTGTISKVYDGTTNATLAPANVALTGAISGDQVALATTGASYDTRNVGTGKTVSAAGLTLTGSSAGNYRLASTTASATIGAITTAPLSITVNDTQKLLNAPNPAFTVRYSGFVAGETSSALNGTLAFSTLADITSPPGLYSVSASGQTSSNYAITYVPGTLTIVAFTQFDAQDGTTPLSFATKYIHTPTPTDSFTSDPLAFDDSFVPAPPTSPVVPGQPLGVIGTPSGDWANAGSGGGDAGTDLMSSGPAPMSPPSP